jgi:meso-butanediol dehydrogenase / (S,S)-butanediol dehydrogenase / diacetyl reductase
MSRFQEKTVIVTGAASGIGRVTARRFAGEGASVVVADWNRDGAEETAAAIEAGGGHAFACGVDVSRADQADAMVAEALARFGGLDVLVNNAAVCRADTVLETTAEEWDADLAIDLKGVFLCARAALRPMVEQRSGAIVNVSSVNGLAAFGNEAYSAAKAGVINLTNSIAVRHGRDGIRCNAVAPGTIRSPAWDERAAREPAIFERLARWYPLGRVGEPEDVAAAVLFLASDEASWITGTVLRVDGGVLSGNPEMVSDVLGEGRS